MPSEYDALVKEVAEWKAVARALEADNAQKVREFYDLTQQLEKLKEWWVGNMAYQKDRWQDKHQQEMDIMRAEVEEWKAVARANMERIVQLEQEVKALHRYEARALAAEETLRMVRNELAGWTGRK